MQNVEVLDSKNESRSATPSVWWRRKPSRRATIVTLAVAGAAAGLFFGWGWVAAAGLSSIVLGLLPCVAMCAAGLCMNRLGKKRACETTGAPATVEKPADLQVSAISGGSDAPLLDDGNSGPKDEHSGR